ETKYDHSVKAVEERYEKYQEMRKNFDIKYNELCISHDELRENHENRKKMMKNKWKLADLGINSDNPSKSVTRVYNPVIPFK
ncbi:MAG: hypothetical protein WD512_05590, partial [Candidatus Paceibacterota bacterium]